MDQKYIKITPEVIKAINEELAYQNKMGGTHRADDVDHGLAGQLVTMRVYLGNAEREWTVNKGDILALNQLRKVVATGIRALVKHGCPPRLEIN